MTFSEKYCVLRGIAEDQFEEQVFRQSLRPAARALRWLLALNPEFFAADLAFVRGVGRLQRLAEFEGEAVDFMNDPDNRGFLRRGLNLRVSGRRLHGIMRATMEHGGATRPESDLPADGRQ